MQRHKRLLVSVELGSDATELIRYTGLIARASRSERISFLSHFHEMDASAIPVAQEALVAGAAAEIATWSAADWPAPQVAWNVTREESLAELLRQAIGEGADMLIVERESGTHHSVALAVRLVRKAPCSVLVVLRGNKAQIARILVPVDFSEPSRDAMEMATALAHALGRAEVKALHAYDVPIGYHKSGMSFEQFALALKAQAEQKYSTLTQQLNLGEQVPLECVQEGRTDRAITEAVTRDGADLVVMGARGKTAAAAVLLGSVAEQVVREALVPVLVVKRKGQGLNFLQALLEV